MRGDFRKVMSGFGQQMSGFMGQMCQLIPAVDQRCSSGYSGTAQLVYIPVYRAFFGSS